MRRAARLALTLLLVAAHPGIAAAAGPDPLDPPRPDPPVTLALVAGMTTALVPLVLGALHTAGSRGVNDGPRDVGYAVGGVGPVLAPIVAHVVLGEYKRAAVSGIAPLVGEIALCVLMAKEPDAIFHGTTLSRTSFAVFYSLDIFGAAFGLVDVMMARERLSRSPARSAKGSLPLMLSPSVGRGHAGLVLGGSL